MGVYLHDGGDGDDQAVALAKSTQEYIDELVSIIKKMTETQQRMNEVNRGLLKQIKKVKSRVADLESVLDDLPQMTELFQAVQEIQDQYEKPAMTFSHYLRG